MGPRWGCSVARPPGFPRSWPLGTHRPLPSLWVAFPVGFWQNEHQYEPGKCCWDLALGSEELPTSRGLEGKSRKKARLVLQKKAISDKYSAQAAFEPAVNSSLAESVIACLKYQCKNVFAQHKPDLHQHFPLCTLVSFPQDSRSEKFTLVQDLSPHQAKSPFACWSRPLARGASSPPQPEPLPSGLFL